MTHEGLRELLGAYAAGALNETASEAVRAHLADGCLECLRDVFGRPVGLPRESREPRPAPVEAAAPGPIPQARRGWGGLVAAVVALALALAAVLAWMVVELRGQEAASRARAAALEDRLHDAEAARASLMTSIAVLERAMREVEEKASGQAEAVRLAAEEGARLREEEAEAARAQLATVRRELKLRERELDRLRLGVGDRSVPAELLTNPGAELLPLAPVAPFRDVRGHVLRGRGHERGVVYLFRLPQLPAGGAYRVRVGLASGAEVSGPRFTVDTRGSAVLTLPLDGSEDEVREIAVVLEPSDRRLLAWRRGAPGG